MELVNESPRVLGNRYELGALLGRGGMAEVHLGHDGRLGRTVAIKLLRTDLARDPMFQARFRREAHSAAALNHPAIVAVYDTGEEPVRDSGGGDAMLPYIVMEHVQGRTLRDMVEDGRNRILASLPPGSDAPSGAGALDLGFALEATAGVLSALEYSHRSGIVHRDIKPANVMVTPAGAVKVMDFGIARALADSSATMTQTHAVIGTAQYLSPEQARGEQVDARSDLYSTGCLLFELLTGRPPFVGDSPVSIAYQHVREEPPLPSSINHAVPDTIDRIVMHALTKDRNHRYQNASEFRQDLEAALAGRPVAAPAATGVTQAMAADTATQFIPGPGGLGTTTMAAGSVLPTPPGTADPYDPYGTGTYPSRRNREEQPRSRGPAYALLALAFVAAIVIGVWAVMYGNGDDTKDDPQSTRIPVPSVVEKPVEDARTILEDAGFTVRVEDVMSDLDEKGIVLEQAPPDGTAERGSEIVLQVGTGPNSVEVPDVKGKGVDEARQELTGKGLKVSDELEYVDLTEDIVAQIGIVPDRGEVVRTSPPAGDSAQLDESVSLVVSTGNVFVPNVTDMSLAKALRVLRSLKFKVQTKEQEDESVAPGTVLMQSTQNGVTVRLRSEITLTVASRPKASPSMTTTSPPTPDPSVSLTVTAPATPTETYDGIGNGSGRRF